jgi:ribosome-binding protein aMBF1 (putative translation factor)
MSKNPRLSAAMVGNLNRAMWGKATKYDPRRERAYRHALAHRVRNARLEADVSIDELAAAIAGHPRTIHEIETAAINPKFMTIVRIAVALGLSPSELMP